MDISYGSFRSTNDSTDIRYTVWSSVKKPRVIIQLAHGMAEYIGRYDEFAKVLAEKGYVVYGNDHIGHGKSINSEEELGHIAGKEGFINIVKDMHALSEIAKKENPNIPLILFGHSMGSLLSRQYASMYKDELCGLILCGTSGSNPLASIGLVLISVISLIKGERHRSKFIYNMAFGAYNDRYQSKRTDIDWLSVNEENVDEYFEDKLCGFVFTVSAFSNLMKLLKSVTSKKWYNSVSKELPILIISGSEDPVGGFRKGVEETELGLKLAGIKDLKMIIYDGLRHEILKEKEKETVYKDIISFIEQTVEKNN